MTPLELGLSWIREENGSYVVGPSKEEDIESVLLDVIHVAEDHGKARRGGVKVLSVTGTSKGMLFAYFPRGEYDRLTGRSYEYIDAILRDAERINLHREHKLVRDFFEGEKPELTIRIVRNYNS